MNLSVDNLENPVVMTNIVYRLLKHYDKIKARKPATGKKRLRSL